MPTFDDCPVEIIELIAQTLPHSDIRNLRQANKRAALGTFRPFAKTGFSRVGFMITAESIQLLDNISQHEGLARYVEDIFLNSVNLAVYRDPCADLDYRVRYKLGKPQPICLELRECEEYHSVVASNKLFVGTDDLRDRLCLLLPRLKNLRKLGTRSNTGDQDLRGWRSRPVFKWLERHRSEIRRMPLHPELFWILSWVINALNLKIEHLYTDNIQLQQTTLAQPHCRLEAAALLRRFDCQLPACGSGRFRFFVNDADKITATCETMHDILRAMPNLDELGMVIYEPYGSLGSPEATRRLLLTNSFGI